MGLRTLNKRPLEINVQKSTGVDLIRSSKHFDRTDYRFFILFTGPITASQREQSEINTSIGDCYLKKLEIPYLKFVRDTLSYIILLGLQCVLCVVPSTIKFNKLEWIILVFFFGRLLVECKQFVGTRRRLKQRRADGRAETCNITCKALQRYFG